MDPTEPERLHELFMALVRASGLLQSDRLIPGHPVSMSQAFALHELAAGTPLSQRELTERLGLEKSTVSRMAADLEQRGLLARERDPDNRRLYRLRLTDAGRAVHRGMVGGFRDRFVHWTAELSEAERTALLTGLPALIRVIRAHPAHGPNASTVRSSTGS